jgi:hypothetical protein
LFCPHYFVRNLLDRRLIGNYWFFVDRGRFDCLGSPQNLRHLQLKLINCEDSGVSQLTEFFQQSDLL